MSARLPRLGALTLAPLFALALAGCPTPPGPVDSDIALRSFSNCGQLRDYAEESILEQMIQSRYTWWYWGPMAEGDADAANDSGGSDGPSDYTTTNVQEAGVDEVDIVKTDGNFIYNVEGDELHIVKSWPIDDTQLLSTLDLGGYAYGMFLYEDTAVVFSWFYDENGFTDRWWGGTRVSFVDVSDRTDPEVTRTLEYEGWMADARLIDDDAYLVLNTYLPIPQEAWDLLWNDQIELPEMDWEASEEEQEAIREQARDILRPYVHDIVQDLDIDDLLPLYRDTVAGEQPGDPQRLLQCSNVYRPAQVSHYSMMSVVHIDVDDGDQGATGVLSDGWEVYASKDNLYVAQTSWWWWWGWGDLDLDTHIHKFKLEGGDPEYVAAGKVDGWLLNQFSMSEDDGYLRVASTETDWWWGTGEDQGGNHVTILQDDGQGELDEVGSVRDIAPGERITAVRFLGDVGYVVTFQWIDPLFTLDLSDPTDPELKGELELPGFSTYMHPMDEDHLLTVGYAGDEDGRITGMAINVFDVSDLSNPQLAHQYTLESDDWSWSEALWNHHAFTYHRDVLSLPIYTYDYDEVTGYWHGFSGMLVMSATKDGLSELGRVDHSDLVDESDCYYEGYYDDCYWYAWMRRSVYVEDNLFSISNYGMKVNDLNDPDTEHARVIFHPSAL